MGGDADKKLIASQVGNEFGAVEALWSQFENVMAKEEGERNDEGAGEGNAGEEEAEEREGEEETIVDERKR